MTQIKKDTLLEAIAVAKEWMSEKKEIIHIIKSWSEGLVHSDTNKRVFYIEDENEPGLFRNWEESLFLYSDDPYEQKGIQARKRNKAIKQLEELSKT